MKKNSYKVILLLYCVDQHFFIKKNLQFKKFKKKLYFIENSNSKN